MTLRALAPAKVNLCLFVGRPRADGLHPLVSVMQPLSLADELTLAAAPPGTAADEVVCPGVDGPNLAGRALGAFRDATGWDAPAQRLTIAKRVPVAAGLGGGSGDAAAALRLAAAAAGRDAAVAALAPALGSDVPAQLLARPCLVTGVGERLEPLPDPPPFAVLVLPSRERLSTPAVYAELDRLGGGRAAGELADLAARIRAAVAAGEALAGDLAHNDLEHAARSLCPSIDAALDDVRAEGADRALVSGSGPTVIGWFAGDDGARRARAAAERLRARHPGAVVAEPVPPSFTTPRPA